MSCGMNHAHSLDLLFCRIVVVKTTARLSHNAPDTDLLPSHCGNQVIRPFAQRTGNDP